MSEVSATPKHGHDVGQLIAVGDLASGDNDDVERRRLTVGAPNALAKARERVERSQSADARNFGGRRTGFVTADATQHAVMVEMERRLLDLARRAIRKHR